MLILKAYWAGMLIFQKEAQEKELETVTAGIKESLIRGEITHTHVGHLFTVEELCIDVYKAGKIFRMFQFKK